MVNDEFYNVFEKYNRYMNNRASKGETSGTSNNATATAAATAAANAIPVAPSAAMASTASGRGTAELIDFDEGAAGSVAEQLKSMSKL